jgi:predicted Zn-ribbon and HTH transcriptional regulator
MSYKVLGVIPYVSYTEDWIKKQGRMAYALGQQAMVNGLIQNAVEVPNVNKIVASFSGNEFSIQNDGDKPFVKEDAESIHGSKKVGQIGQLGEETKLSIGWMKDLQLTFISRNNTQLNAFLLDPKTAYNITPPHKISEWIRTEVSGILDDTPDIREIISFLTAVHNINLQKKLYSLSVNDNGNIIDLTPRLPLEQTIIHETLNGEDGNGNHVTDHITIYLWNNIDWSTVGKCPYANQNGVYLLCKGVLITWKGVWGSVAAHERTFALVDDEEGRLFSTIVTRDKQVPNEKAKIYVSARKLWMKNKPKEIPSSREEMEKIMSKKFQKMMVGDSATKITYKCSNCGYVFPPSEEKPTKCPKCESTKFEPAKTERKQKYLYRCTDNNIPSEYWDRKLEEIKKIPKFTIMGCVEEIEKDSPTEKVMCSCGHLMKRVIENPDQANRKFKVEIHSDENYKLTPFLKINDPIGGIIYVNDLDPLYQLYALEFRKEDTYTYTYALFIELGTLIKKSELPPDILDKKNLELIEIFKTWRTSKKSAIRKAKSDLMKNGEDRAWFADY